MRRKHATHMRMYQVGAEMFESSDMRATRACMLPLRACCWCMEECNLEYKKISKKDLHPRCPVSAESTH